MYNGIGLRTPRGSGTNGYVQKNLSFVNTSRQPHTTFKPPVKDEDRGKLRKANTDIIEHNEKRQVEVLVETWALDNDIYDKGYTDEEIDALKAKQREIIRGEREQSNGMQKSVKEMRSTYDMKETHQRSYVKEAENDRFAKALRLPADYVPGQSMDKRLQEERKQKKKEEWEAREKEKEKEKKLREKEERIRRGGRSPSPSPVRGNKRSPSPVRRGARSPSPSPVRRGGRSPSPVRRGGRSPSPSPVRGNKRSPSPVRKARSPSHSPSPVRRGARSPSPSPKSIEVTTKK
eukprot:gene12299-14419_t